MTNFNKMDVIEIHDKARIERFLRKNTSMHLYELGDLDDRYYQDTRWYAGVFEEKLIALAMLYTGLSLPNFIALEQDTDALKDLLTGIRNALPNQFYAHLSPGLDSVFRSRAAIAHHGPHYKMNLADRSKIKLPEISEVVILDRGDVPDLIQLYEKSYPDSWFDQSTFENSIYTGIRIDGELVSAAGTHVFSEYYKVAALGNITTHPQFRNRGYGAKVVAGLCHELLDTVDHIGLNVRTSNKAAVKLYENLGFQKIGTYHEYMISG